MIEILTNPDKFFEVKKEEEVSLKIPALIVLIIGIISGIGAYFMGGLTAEMLSGTLPPEAQAFLSFISISTAIAAVIFSLILWVVVAALSFGISYLFKGEGKFKRTLEFVGYGFIPMIISGIISAILMYNIVSTAHIPVVTDPALIEGALEPLMKDPLMQLSFIIGILFMLWSANIWVFGLKHARNLTTKNALISVGIPINGYFSWIIVWNSGQIIGGLGSLLLWVGITIFGLLLHVLLAIEAYRDAQELGVRSVRWLIIVLILGIIGWIIWFIVRPKEKINA